MKTRRLSFAIGQQRPVDAGVRLPAGGVRPWVWLGGPNVGTITLSEHGIPENPSGAFAVPSPTVTTPTSTDRSPIGGRDQWAGDVAVGEPEIGKLDLSDAGTPTPTDPSLADSEEVLEPWTERASQWLAPLQMSITNFFSPESKDHKPDSGATTQVV